MIVLVKIKKQLISSRAITSGNGNAKKYITIHQTANTSKGANAQAHANLQSNGNSRSASWHWTVDDKQAIQSFPHSVKCWHAGNGTGNNQSIGIELCVNSDANYKKVIENAAELVKKIMKEENISIMNVKQHNHWSGKNCPAQLRAGKDGISWNGFIDMIKGKEVKPSKPQVKPSTSTKPKPYTQDAKYPKLQNKGANVGKWQRKLKKLGYYTGKIDNSFGPATDKATRAFQKSNGLAVDGQAGPASNKKADSLIKSKGKITVPNKNLYLTSPQMQGTAVRQLQEALASIHFYPNKGAKNNGIDGYYGPKTADAVKRFQSVNGLKTDGSFGPATRKKLKQKV